MADLVKLLEEHGIAEASLKKSKRIVAEVIQKYLTEEPILLEGEVVLALRRMDAESPGDFTDTGVEQYSKPSYNPHIDALHIKYMHFQEALQWVTHKKKYKTRVKYNWCGKKPGKGFNLTHFIIFYRNKRELRSYISARLTGPETIHEYTFRAPEELFSK